MGQIENAKRLTLPAFQVFLYLSFHLHRAQMGPVQGLVENNAASNSQLFQIQLLEQNSFIPLNMTSIFHVTWSFVLTCKEYENKG